MCLLCKKKWQRHRKHNKNKQTLCGQNEQRIQTEFNALCGKFISWLLFFEKVVKAKKVQQ